MIVFLVSDLQLRGWKFIPEFDKRNAKNLSDSLKQLRLFCQSGAIVVTFSHSCRISHMFKSKFDHANDKVIRP